MSDVSIVTDNCTVTARTPYDADFVQAAKDLGGLWDGAVWKFAHRDLDRVTDLAHRIYGTDGSDALDPTVIVRIPLGGICDRYTRQEYRLAGRTIVRRPSRDQAVRYGDNVVLIAGGFPGRGGSMKYPDLLPHADTVVEVRDLPRGAADLILLQHPGAEIVDSAVEHRAALLAEADRLCARLAEIGVELGGPAQDNVPAGEVTVERRTNGEVVVRGVTPAFETNPKGLLFDSRGEPWPSPSRSSA